MSIQLHFIEAISKIKTNATPTSGRPCKIDQLSIRQVKKDRFCVCSKDGIGDAIGLYTAKNLLLINVAGHVWNFYYPVFRGKRQARSRSASINTLGFSN